MVDDFEMTKVYEERTYERDLFKLSIKGKEFKGNYHENEIQWLHPHPKQTINKKLLEKIETEIVQLITKGNGIEDSEDVEIEPFLEKFSREAYKVKLKVDGEEYKGMIQEGDLEWFHPKPLRKLEGHEVEEMEKIVHDKVKDQSKL